MLYLSFSCGQVSNRSYPESTETETASDKVVPQWQLLFNGKRFKRLASSQRDS